MKRAEALQLIDTLLARHDASADARRAFEQRFPDAPKEMIDAATFHVCVDGIDAALVWLASIEKFLEKPDSGLDCGATWHLLHHLYNWQQLDALMPLGRMGLIEHLGEIKTFLDEAHPDAARETIEDLLKCLRGDLDSPGIE